MTSVGVVDLAEAMALAAELAEMLDQPLVVCGALAMAAHGYRRQTSDVDIVLPVVVGASSGDAVEEAAKELGLEVRARHSFGGFDLRAKGVRIDVLTLDRAIDSLVSDAIAAAVEEDVTVDIFGQEAYVVPLGYLIAMKLVAQRKKDLGDVVELIKVQMDDGDWATSSYEVAQIVRQQLGDTRVLEELARDAHDELRR